MLYTFSPTSLHPLLVRHFAVDTYEEGISVCKPYEGATPALLACLASSSLAV